MNDSANNLKPATAEPGKDGAVGLQRFVSPVLDDALDILERIGEMPPPDEYVVLKTKDLDEIHRLVTRAVKAAVIMERSRDTYKRGYHRLLDQSLQEAHKRYAKKKK